MTTRHAACCCGQLHLTIEGEPLRISMCHCLECQRRTGAVISNQARFRRDQVTIAGNATAWTRTAESGNALTFHFCPTCGSTVYWEGAGFPGYVAVAIGTFADPNTMTGCLDLLNGGDLDFDGTSYWADWPTGTKATQTTPASFVQSAPMSKNHRYEQSFFQTDVALSESVCAESDDISNCTVPPAGPGNFYPFWSTMGHGRNCSILFGNVTNGPGVKSYGGPAQYGTDGRATFGYDEFLGPVTPAVC